MRGLPPDWKNEVLADFSRWLRDLPEDGPDGPGDSQQRRSLAELYAEFAALRQDIAIQGRAQKKALVGLESTRESMASLTKALAARGRERDPAEERADLREVLSSFLDVRDALIRTRALAREAHAADGEACAGLAETLDLVVSKFDRILAGHGIDWVQTVGAAFDAATMNAVGVRDQPDLPGGTVVEEIRSGFVQNGHVLRTAEVLVNRLDGTGEGSGE